MTIPEAVAKLQQEKLSNVPSRFPCRAIMVKNIRQYSELLSELRKISDIEVVQSQELFTNADTMPKYENLKNERYRNKWLVLTGVSEYLRLYAKNEISDRRFASLWSYQAAANSTGRIIIPLWGCEAQWYDKSLNLMGDLRQEYFYFDCTDTYAEEQNMKLLVLSSKFEKYIPKLENMQGNLKIGLQDWFEYWMDPVTDKEEFVLLTKRANSVSTTNGHVSIHVISDTLTLIQESMQGTDVLTQANCTEEMQEDLLPYALKGVDLEDAILSILNMSTFSGIDAMSRWKTMSSSHKQFVWLWFMIHPDNTYLCHCFSVTNSISDLSATILHEIFKVWINKSGWVHEYCSLVQIMSIKPDAQFFNELDAISVYEQRLDFIVGSSREERIYLLNMVGRWLRTDRNQVKASSKLMAIFPELFAYLSDESIDIDSELKLYMSKYKAYKLENTLPVDEDTYFNGIQTDGYDMRYSVLSEFIDQDTVILWVDALGVEWMPLLHWTLSRNCDAAIVNSTVVQATLPTETEYNDQWKLMSVPYAKLDKLDKLAHKGMIDEPNYYVCIQEQLEFVTGIYAKVSELMGKYHRVIITGDHGTSRLAARFFHVRDGLEAPSHAEICSHGRYCKIKTGTSMTMANIQVVKAQDDTHYAVFQNYDHFKQSGYAAGADDENAIYGEVHGGATPEEMLVPVIVLDSKQDIPINGEWEKDTVKISMRKARFRINFNKSVKQLQVRIAGVDGETTNSQGGRTWDVVFTGIKQGSYTPQVYADTKIISMPDVTIIHALGGGDGDLPW